MGYLEAIKLSWNNSCDLYSNTPQYPQLHFFWGLLRNHLKLCSCVYNYLPVTLFSFSLRPVKEKQK